MDLDARFSSLTFLSPSFAASAMPAACCWDLDFAGISFLRKRPYRMIGLCAPNFADQGSNIRSAMLQARYMLRRGVSTSLLARRLANGSAHPGLCTFRPRPHGGPGGSKI